MPISLAVTTAVNPSGTIETEARALTEALHALYVERIGRSLPDVFAVSDADRLLIVGSDKVRLRDRATGTEYFYHPNLFQVRAANVLRGVPDHFLEATGLSPGGSLLDCTLGFASEASLAALVVGDTGRVVGLESVPELAAVTQIGVQKFVLQNKTLEAALRRVSVVSADARDYLPRCADDGFDVVYFDPFFEHRLRGSEASVSPLFLFGNPAPLDAEAVRQARRVAKRRVVIKHPRDEPLPEEIEEAVTETIASRTSRLVFRVISCSRH